jgi:Polyketide cyclase / dehydrase and lipid transport
MASEDTTLQEIDAQAPVVGSSEIEVAATPEAAWAVLAAIGEWPSWNPAVKSVSFESGLEEGSEFRWKAGPGTIKSTIRDLDPPWRIAWTGTSLGLKAIHVHTFERHNGGTIVRTEESYDGLVARLFRGRLQRMLDSALRGELQHLKAEAERRERPP